MTIANFIPEFWETALVIALRKSYVYPGLTNRNYEGTVQNSGDTVRLTTPAPLTINSPATGTPGQPDITFETPTSTQQVLLINQSADFDFQIYSMEELQSNVDLAVAYMNEGGNGLSDTLDQNIAALYTDATVTVSIDQTTYDADILQQGLIDVGVALSNGSVPSQGRWLVADPRTIGLIRKLYGVSSSTEAGMEISKNGLVTRQEGFDIYESLNVPVTAGPDESHCLAGNNTAITLAMQMAPSVRALELEGIHGDGFQSLMVWGRKTVRPDAIVEFAVQHGA